MLRPLQPRRKLGLAVAIRSVELLLAQVVRAGQVRPDPWVCAYMSRAVLASLSEYKYRRSDPFRSIALVQNPHGV